MLRSRILAFSEHLIVSRVQRHLRLLCLYPRKICLHVPRERTLRREQPVDLLQRPICGLGIESPYQRDAQEVDYREDVERVFRDGIEHDGVEHH